jgi:hypothetical protein
MTQIDEIGADQRTEGTANQAKSAEREGRKGTANER